MKPLNIAVGQDKKGETPICPHCDQDLTIIKDYRSHLKFLSNMHVFTCPSCRKVLSITVVPK